MSHPVTKCVSSSLGNFYYIVEPSQKPLSITSLITKTNKTLITVMCFSSNIVTDSL